MKSEEQLRRWQLHVEEFNRQNLARPSRLGVIYGGGALEDYWLEDGLPFAAVALDSAASDSPVIQIMLGAEGESERSLTHTVSGVKKLKFQLTDDGRDDGLDVEDREGSITILRFESGPEG